MTQVLNIGALIILLGQYFLYRMGLRKAVPNVPRYYDRGLAGLDFMFGWWRKVRVVHPEKCAKSGPAIFAGNHQLIDDPFVMGNAINRLSQGRIRPNVMMRDDFFTRMPRWAKTILDPDEVAHFIGAIMVTREGAEASQLITFVKLLEKRGVFLIYPGRSRSRTGMFLEYRDWIRSPGATSFFLAKAQEDCIDLEVPAIPVTRTHNPVTRRSTLVFGDPLYLPPHADHAQQREWDYRLAVALSDLVEVNVPHVVSAILYLRCLHGLPDGIDMPSLLSRVKEVFAKITQRQTDPEALANPEGEIRKVLEYLQSKRLLRVRGDRVEMDRAAILAAPASISQYQQTNPLKHLVNQVLHLADVVRSIEEAALRA